MLRGTPADMAFVYVISEQPGGPLKIGTAGNPIRRLRELQVGNPRRLKIECVIYGGRETERMLHEYWQEHRIGGNVRRAALNAPYAADTEWFKAEARAEIIAATACIADHQRHPLPGDDHYLTITKRVMTECGYVLRRGDTVTELGRHGGYVERRLRA